MFDYGNFYSLFFGIISILLAQLKLISLRMSYYGLLLQFRDFRSINKTFEKTYLLTHKTVKNQILVEASDLAISF